jgi:hypothetical protein
MDGRSSYESSAKKLANYYFAYLDKELTSQLIHSLSNNDLSILIESLFSIEFYTGITFNKSVALNKFLNVFKEMEIRKIATIEQAQNIYTALLRYGNWADSREVLKSWPTISPSIMPIIEDIEKISDDELGYYVLSADLKTLDLKKLNNDKGPKIIMFADCHFAFDVFKYLGQEKDLTEIMSQWGLVVGGYDFDKIDLLRKQFPSFEIHPMHVQGSWFQKGFDIFSSPSTVFLKDGIIKYRTTGSTGRYIVSDFCRGLDSIGLALPLSCTK